MLDHPQSSASRSANTAQRAPDAAILCAEALGKKFGALEVLRGVSLAVAKGEVISIIGPSGSGKSTLLRCFALLEAPSSGRILMEGEVIACAPPDAEVERRIRRRGPRSAWCSRTSISGRT